jgi:hypothetical protein
MAASNPSVPVTTSSDDNPQAAVASGSSQSGLTDEDPKTIIAAINQLSKEMKASTEGNAGLESSDEGGHQGSHPQFARRILSSSAQRDRRGSNEFVFFCFFVFCFVFSVI